MHSALNQEKIVSLRLVILATLFATGSPTLNGQSYNHECDHVLNYKGQSRITFATGIPHVAISEYAYGVSDRVTAGALVQ